MKYITKATNKITVRKGYENLIDESIQDILNGKFQRELTGYPILKCTATARKTYSNSAVMEVWLYSNENPVEELRNEFMMDDWQKDSIKEKFIYFETEFSVTENGNAIFKAAESYENDSYNSKVLIDLKNEI